MNSFDRQFIEMKERGQSRKRQKREPKKKNNVKRTPATPNRVSHGYLTAEG